MLVQEEAWQCTGATHDHLQIVGRTYYLRLQRKPSCTGIEPHIANDNGIQDRNCALFEHTICWTTPPHTAREIASMHRTSQHKLELSSVQMTV